MSILSINTGSSSVRLAVFALVDKSLTLRERGHFSDNLGDPAEILRTFLKGYGIGKVAVVAHRIVHGGSFFTAPCWLDGEVEAEIRRLVPLAPLHNPLALRWVAACRTVFGEEIGQMAVFDTAFYATLPEVAATYALPPLVCRKHDIRRYGFHGLAHQAMWRRWRELQPETHKGLRVISLQLGAGCSITAIRDGQAVDTSMGFSPLEGLVMATRSGDIDPGLLLYLLRAGKMSADELNHLLTQESGLRGMAGESDMRRLLDSDEASAQLAVELYCYRAHKYVGAYLAVLGGADAILFGGGVGEHAPEIRERILAGMEWAGIVLDRGRNHAAVGAKARISRDDSPVAIWAIPVDEAQLLAEAAAGLLTQPMGNNKESQS
ncbi:MAG: acetate/propionate family kinase [Gallionellaceae bacterium]